MSGILIIARPADAEQAAELKTLLSGTFARVKVLPPNPNEAEKAINNADVALVLTGADWAQTIADHPDVTRAIAYALSVADLPVLHVPLDGAKLPAATALPPDFPPELRALTYLSSVPVSSGADGLDSVAHLAREVAEVLEQTGADFDGLVTSPAMRKSAQRRRQSLPINIFMIVGIVACGLTTIFLARGSDNGALLPPPEMMEEADMDADDAPALFIGLAADLSGGTADIGLAILAGVQLALDDRPLIDADGDEIRVALLAQDSACSGAGGQRVAEAFAASPDVVGVIGDQCNIGCTVAVSIYDAAEIISISPTCNAPELTRNPSDSFNRVIAPTTAEAVAVADYLFETVGDGVALVYDEQQHARQFAPVFEARYAALGGTASVIIPTETGIIDYDFIVETLLADGATAVYYIGRAVNAGAIRARLGAEVPFVASVLGDVAVFTEHAADFADGVLMMRVLPPEVTPDFAARYDGDNLTAFAYAYDATTILLDALAGVVTATDDAIMVDRSTLQTAIRAYQGDGVTGVLDCGGDGDCATPNVGLFVIDGGALVEAES